jgi:hypothetical protein
MYVRMPDLPECEAKRIFPSTCPARAEYIVTVLEAKYQLCPKHKRLLEQYHSIAGHLYRGAVLTIDVIPGAGRRQ